MEFDESYSHHLTHFFFSCSSVTTVEERFQKEEWKEMEIGEKNSCWFLCLIRHNRTSHYYNFHLLSDLLAFSTARCCCARAAPHIHFTFYRYDDCGMLLKVTRRIFCIFCHDGRVIHAKWWEFHTHEKCVFSLSKARHTLKLIHFISLLVWFGWEGKKDINAGRCEEPAAKNKLSSGWKRRRHRLDSSAILSCIICVSCQPRRSLDSTIRSFTRSQNESISSGPGEN